MSARLVIFNNIPQEMRLYRQWVLWRLEKTDRPKPTKPPYMPRPGGGRANPMDAATWGTWEEVIAAPITCVEAVDPTIPVSETGYSGIGFVATDNDPYSFIDLDDTNGDTEAHAQQLHWYSQFNSYTEFSPSGKGVHIIVKGSVPMGRRRKHIELYPHARFMTMTGNVLNNVPIMERQHELMQLFNSLGGEAKNFIVTEEVEQRVEDEDVINQAGMAVNGEKFKALYTGQWQPLYESQSEADFALIDIIAFYTQNRAQIKRIFRASALGQRDKAKRDDYIDRMIDRAFDRTLPPVDTEGLLLKVQERMAATGGATGEPGGTPAAPTNVDAVDANGNAGAAISHGNQGAVNNFPPGLLGQIAQYFLDAAPRPVPEIALAGAIAYLSGLVGRAYNISGTGLNQYILYLAPTGVGKDAVADGVAKLNAQVANSVPTIYDFKGPGELVSSAGLIKWIANHLCCFSILGEFGKKMKEMASPHANAHLVSISRVLLQMYSKSGHGSVFDPMAYSDKEKNTATLQSPCLTILGESVPDSFYESLDETLISDGLLPRFMVFEYTGDRAYLNKAAADVMPPFDLVQNIATLVASCQTIMSQQKVHNVRMTPEAQAKFDEFDRWTTDVINRSNEVPRQLWNRAHLKALKLAAVRAIGENWVEPIVTLEHCMWATKIVVDQSTKMVAKFETGQVGQVGGSEGKQIGEVIKAIASYLQNDHSRYSKYGGTYEMHKAGIVLEGHLQRRLINMACFRQDRLGPTQALKRALKTLLEADELREVPKSQMVQTYGTGPRAFVVSNPARFFEKVPD